MNEIIKSALTVLFHHKLIEEAEALEKVADTCRCDNCQAYRASFAKDGYCPICDHPGRGACDKCGWDGSIPYGESCL